MGQSLPWAAGTRSPSAPAELQQEEGAGILQGCTAAHKGAFQLHSITLLSGFFFILFVSGGRQRGKERKPFPFFLDEMQWGDFLTMFLVLCRTFTRGFPCLGLSFQGKAEWELVPARRHVLKQSCLSPSANCQRSRSLKFSSQCSAPQGRLNKLRQCPGL